MPNENKAKWVSSYNTTRTVEKNTRAYGARCKYDPIRSALAPYIRRPHPQGYYSLFVFC